MKERQRRQKMGKKKKTNKLITCKTQKSRLAECLAASIKLLRPKLDLPITTMARYSHESTILKQRMKDL
ncbi:hypothetical protein O6P43_001636 [Quillaja saponaria]|uniref:Uncharacterized protein n=1 Tax=Quillaja saponaria TaxID=32244 RepID=A0AAD7VNF3_QUISA|nr:hypothetical protein O6P43_001636 [Quillaja saponaria]